MLMKLDQGYLEFLRNLPLKVGKENTSLTIKAHDLFGIDFPNTLSEVQVESDFAGNVIMNYLKKTVVYEAYTA